MKWSEIAGACFMIAAPWIAYLIGWLDGVPWWMLAACSTVMVLVVGLRILLLRTGLVPRQQPPLDRLEKILVEILYALLAYSLAGLFLAPDPWSPPGTFGTTLFGARQTALVAQVTLGLVILLVAYRIWRIRRTSTRPILLLISVAVVMAAAVAATWTVAVPWWSWGTSFDYTATAAAPPIRIGVFEAWTATRTARVEGQRFNCQADTGPLDPAPHDAHPWARARLAIYEFPGTEYGGTVAFWVRRMLPPGTPALLEAGGQRVLLERGGGGPVRLAQNSAALLALLERTAAADPDAVVTVTAPTGPGEAEAVERFSLRGFRTARRAVRAECGRTAGPSEFLVMDGGLVRFGTGWNVHAIPTDTPGRRSCFVAARQLLRRGIPDAQGPRLVVARRGAPEGGDLVGFDPGLPYADGTVAILRLGGQQVPMPVRAGVAEARDGNAVVGALLAAATSDEVTIIAPGDNGGEIRSRFSVDGFRWTYEALPIYCAGPP
jgi:hypothetical protein